jgi:hypothetical protein
MGVRAILSIVDYARKMSSNSLVTGATQLIGFCGVFQKAGKSVHVTFLQLSKQKNDLMDRRHKNA